MINSQTQTQFRVPTAESLHVETAWDGTYACGDWIGYDTPAMWMERSVTTSMASANAVLERQQLDPYPIQSPPPPEITARVIGGIVYVLRRVFAPFIILLISLLRRLRGRKAE